MEKTINQVFRNRADKYRDRIAIEKKKKGKWEQATWNAYYANARATGLALGAFGMEKGNRVSLIPVVFSPSIWYGKRGFW